MSVVIGVFLQEQEVVPEKLGGQQMPSVVETNIPFEQGKPRCM
jgi:hypothetical protein